MKSHHRFSLFSLSHRNHGFTLVEMSMVLLIIGLTVSGLLGMALSMMKSAEIRESTDKVNLLKDN
jgi:prepilin-type N-terminal cleavage/methylation domain-containing protein